MADSGQMDEAKGIAAAPDYEPKVDYADEILRLFGTALGRGNSERATPVGGDPQVGLHRESDAPGSTLVAVAANWAEAYDLCGR